MSIENAEIVRRIWESFDDDGFSWLQFFDEECEIRNPPEFPARGPFAGHAGARQWRREIWDVFTDLRHHVTEVIEPGDGETIVTVQRTTGRMRHTDLPVDMEWGAVWTLRDGKVIRAEGYGTRAATLAASRRSE